MSVTKYKWDNAQRARANLRAIMDGKTAKALGLTVADLYEVKSDGWATTAKFIYSDSQIIEIEYPRYVDGWATVAKNIHPKDASDE